MPLRHIALVFALAAGVATLPAKADNLLVNPGFETGDFTGWTVVDTSGDTQVYGTTGYYAPHTGTYEALLGAVSGTGTVSQTVTDVAGQNYIFSFWLADTDGNPSGNTPNSLVASFDGDALYSVTNLPLTAYTEYSFTVTGTGHDTITFTEEDDPGYLSLDDVSLSSTPEPSSLVLLGSGMLGLGGIVRRRFIR